MNTTKLCDRMDETIKREIFKREYVRNTIYSLIFWKNYSNGYVSKKLLDAIEVIADDHVEQGPDGETYITYDQDKAFKIINEIRICIGLPKLIKSKYGSLSEEKIQDLERRDET